MNRLIKITDALSKETHFEYNLRSQMEKVKDALNQEYVFAYDPLGRVLSQTRAGTTMTFEYDPVGNRTKRADHNGTVTNYVYDNLNRLTSGSLGTYTYDDVSQMLTATNVNGTVSFTYDNRGRVDTTTDVYGKVIDYDYDANGNRTLAKLDGVNYSRYTYDDADRPSALHDFFGSRETQYTYDDADRLTFRRYPTGSMSQNVLTTYAYDGMSRLTQLQSYRGGSTYVRLDYTYSTANQISQIVEPTRTRTFTYDNLDRLTAATDTLNGNESYAYDAVGNRTSSHWSSSYSYDPFNRVTVTQATSHTYDNNGAMTSRTGSGGTINFVHDSDGRMLQAYSNPLDPVEYKYDALGRRVSSKQPGQAAITYTFDGDDVMLSNSTAGVSKFINGPGIDNKVSARIAGTTGRTFYLGDHLGTTYGTANDTGIFTGVSRPDSFGNFSTDFTGREYDAFTGLYYYRARMYDPKLGRFISEDPIGFAGGDINLYGYVKHKPTNRRDPMGMDDADRAFYDSLPSGWYRVPLGPADAERIASISACYKKYKFSSVFSGGDPNVETVLEYVEVGSFSSLAADGVATTAKAMGPKTASGNPYASGINMAGRHVNRFLGYPRIGGLYPYKYFLKFGTKATPVLAVTGAFTASYNITTDFQCACGLIK